MINEPFEKIEHRWMERLASSFQSGMQLYRFPTSVLWGADHEDGMRMVWAHNAEAALANRKAVAAHIERCHLQVLTSSGWRFVDRLSV